MGKANRGFRRRIERGAPIVGHIKEALWLILNLEFRTRLFRSLPLEAMNAWGAYEEASLSILAHHGQPVDTEKIPLDEYRAHWLPGADCDPIADLAVLGSTMRRLWPAAFVEGGEPLPMSPRFWHAIAGLTMLADWIGSDSSEGMFPLANGAPRDRMVFARRAAARALGDLGTDPELFRLLSARFSDVSEYPPRPAQLATGDATGHIVALESDTGSGKTEAALYRFARLFAAGQVDGIYFALPTRVAATALHTRVLQAVRRMYGRGEHPAVILAVPGYIRADAVEGRALPAFDVQWDDNPRETVRRSRWAAEAPKRYLAGTVVVGTIDQALLGAITTKHAHMRSSCLLRHLLVVDEVHASELLYGGPAFAFARLSCGRGRSCSPIIGDTRISGALASLAGAVAVTR